MHNQMCKFAKCTLSHKLQFKFAKALTFDSNPPNTITDKHSEAFLAIKGATPRSGLTPSPTKLNQLNRGKVAKNAAAAPSKERAH